mgnify:CR=1 FL=1
MLLNTPMMTHTSLVPVIFLAIGFVVSVCADPVSVGSAAELISLFEKTGGKPLETDIEVTADLDFSGHTLPLGAFSNGTCMSFSGVFQGNGHSIKGLRIDSRDNEGYIDAGLFCSLKNATVENFVIDSSCSFTGNNAGALSVSVNGSLTVRHTTNNADVSGKNSVGGFIGYVSRFVRGAVTSFEDCVNNGNVTGSDDDVGGFIGYFGYLYEVVNVTVAISNSINNGNVTGVFFVAGFIGYLYGNTNMVVSISNSINNGIIKESVIAGGFWGHISGSTNVIVTITNIINNGGVSGSQYMGGIVGSIDYDTNMTTTISNTINNGDITGSLRDVGGFVGDISAFVDAYSMSFNILNSANKGSVSSKERTACGFFCVDPRYVVRTTMKNSINKGSVNAG